MKKLVITKDQENEVPVQVLEQAIVDISEGMKRIRSGRMNDKALILLVQHAAGTNYVSQAQVKAVLDGVRDLSKNFLK